MFIVGLVGELLDGGSRSIDHASVKTKVEHAKDSGKHGPHQGAGHGGHHECSLYVLWKYYKTIILLTSLKVHTSLCYMAMITIMTLLADNTSKPQEYHNNDSS